MKLRTPKDADVSGKTILLRADLNRGFGLRASLPTIKHLTANRAKIVIFSEAASESAGHALAEALARKFLAVTPAESRLPEYAVPHVFFLRGDFSADDLRVLLGQLRGGDIAVLEKPAGPVLSGFGEMYLNDDFSSCHLTDGVFGKMRTAAGAALAAEAAALARLRDRPRHPFVLMIGGAETAGKMSLILALAKTADIILSGGAPANLFLRLRGYEIGRSAAGARAEEAAARQILRDYSQKLKLPVDAVVSNKPDGLPEVAAVDKVRRHQMILDIGPRTILEYSRSLKTADTVFWSGPLGRLENVAFSHGTAALARVFAARTRGAAFGVAVGGDTLRAIDKLGLAEYVDCLSAGGPALENFLAGRPLPGLEALML